MRYIALCLAFLCIFSASDATAAPRKIALVVGIDTVKGTDPNAGEAHDAKMFGDLLAQKGFEVTYALNASRSRMVEMIEAFSQDVAKPETVVVFYYAGYLYNRAGENLIVAGEADLSSQQTTEKSFASLQPLADALRIARDSQRFIFLDPVSEPIPIRISTPNFPARGFAPFKDSAETLVFEARSFRGELVCDKESAFVTSFRHQIKAGGEMGEISRDVARMLDIGGSSDLSPTVTDNRRLRFSMSPEIRKNDASDVFGTLFDKFKKARSCSCGRRLDARFLGEELLERLRYEVLDRPVEEFIKEKLADIDATEPVCRLHNAYNNSYKNRNWRRFLFAADSLVVGNAEEALKLDVLLDAASVSYDRLNFDRNNSYRPLTVDYSRRALAILDKNVRSKTGKFGVFLPFETEKTARFWLNMIIGEMLMKDDPGTALPHFRKAVGVFDVGEAVRKLCPVYLPKCTASGPTAARAKAFDGIENGRFFQIFNAVGDYYFFRTLLLVDRLDKLDGTPGRNNEAKRKDVAAKARVAADYSIDAYARANASLGFPSSLEKDLTRAIFVLNHITPELGSDYFSTPDMKSLLARPVPEWKAIE